MCLQLQSTSIYLAFSLQCVLIYFITVLGGKGSFNGIPEKCVIIFLYLILNKILLFI